MDWRGKGHELYRKERKIVPTCMGQLMNTAHMRTVVWAVYNVSQGFQRCKEPIVSSFWLH